MKRILSCVVLICMLLALVPVAVAANEVALTTDKAVYAEGEAIMVTFDTDRDYAAAKDWIGIWPDEYLASGGVASVYWTYAKDQTEGAAFDISATIASGSANIKPYLDLPAGKYTVAYVRDNSDYGANTVLASVQITIGAEVTLSTDKEVYTEGEPIMVTFDTVRDHAAAKDWIGIWSDNYFSDGNAAVYWTYTSAQTEGTAFDISATTASGGANVKPYLDLPAGNYTVVYVRDNENYATSTALAAVKITIEANEETSVVTDKNVYTVGEPIMVTFDTTRDYAAAKDWIGIWADEYTAAGGAASVYWCYASDFGAGTAFDIASTTASAARSPMPSMEFNAGMILPSIMVNLVACAL